MRRPTAVLLLFLLALASGDLIAQDNDELKKYIDGVGEHPGASQVLIASPHRTALITEAPGASTPDLFQLLARLDPARLDLVLVEGFRDAAFPKIELHRPALGKPLLFPADPHIVAIATDGPIATPAPIPVLNLNDPGEVARLVMTQPGISQLGSSQ